MITKCDHWKNSIPHHYDSVYLTWLNPVLSWLKITTGFCFFFSFKLHGWFFSVESKFGWYFSLEKELWFFFSERPNHEAAEAASTWHQPDGSDLGSGLGGACGRVDITGVPARSILKNVWFVYMYMYLNRYIHIYIVIFGFYRYMNYIHMYI